MFVLKSLNLCEMRSTKRTLRCDMSGFHRHHQHHQNCHHHNHHDYIVVQLRKYGTEFRQTMWGSQYTNFLQTTGTSRLHIQSAKIWQTAKACECCRSIHICPLLIYKLARKLLRWTKVTFQTWIITIQTSLLQAPGRYLKFTHLKIQCCRSKPLDSQHETFICWDEEGHLI